LALILPVVQWAFTGGQYISLRNGVLNAAIYIVFNMDEWSDCEGNTLEPSNPASFQYAMKDAFYNPLGT